MKWLLFFFLSFNCLAESYIDFVTTGVEKGYAVLVYTKSNGEVCKLKLKQSEIASKTEQIKWWFEYVNTLSCESGATYPKNVENGLDTLR